MYVNFKLLKGNYDLLYLLLAAKQKEMLVLEELATQEHLQKLVDQDYLKLIKGTKKQSFFEKVRIGKKGTKFLDDIETPEATDGDVQMFEYLRDMYLNNEDKERTIGSENKIKQYIAIFRQHCGLSLHQMYWLCYYFLEEYKYTKKLEYIFFNSNKNRYGKFKNNIGDSPLYQFYTERKKDVEAFWARKIK